MTKPEIEFRRTNKPYLDAVRKYYQKIMPVLASLQYDNGGPVIAMQVENEYGSYGHDKEYLKSLRQMSIDAGITVPLFTADGAGDVYVQGGLLEGSPLCLTYGSKGLESFALGKKYRPDDPSFCMEFWVGWFNSWGSPSHYGRSADSVADEVDDMIRVGGNINLYMFHGGTNFGFTGGANGVTGGEYTPDTTSYDYDTLLSEWGDPTEKYFKIQNVIKKYHPEAKFGTPVPSEKAAYGKIDFTESAELFDNLDNISQKVHSVSPSSMEKLGQAFGFTHYRTHLNGPLDETAVTLWDVKDRALVFLNGKLVFVYYRNDKENYKPISIPEGGAVLDILVENFGRINYGPLTGKDFKGICNAVSLGGQLQFEWDTWTLPCTEEQLKKVQYKPFSGVIANRPAFYRAEFSVEKAADTFVKFPGVCGVVWVNGRNLGRYWNVGPGSTLYVPAPYLHEGKNEVVVFETEKLTRPYVNFVDKPDIG